MQDVFKCDYKGNAIVATGIRPQFTDRWPTWASPFR